MRIVIVAGRLIPCLALAMLPACASETLFRSSFDGTPIGQPPATAQSVGTAHVDGPAGSVKVIAAPVAPLGKWVEVSRPDGPAVAGMQGKFTQPRGDGVYTFSATMFMPSRSGIATVQFEPFVNQASDLFAFLHLDFTPENHVRIDDNDATAFGTFPRDQPFIVQVTLNINATASTAHIVLAGANASGVKDYTVPAPVQNRSREFGAIRIWQGFPHTGAFDATHISVTRKKQ
jgi:hypothetical protein